MRSFLFLFTLLIFSITSNAQKLHVVSKNETLYSLSKKYNISIPKDANPETLTKEQCLEIIDRKYNKTDKEIDDAIASINTELNSITQSIEDLPELLGSVSQSQTDIRSLKRQILFVEESIQALEAYRTQNNQILLEIQNSINNEIVLDE